ncbi:hypothetical protein GUITHDRAFT_165522 [Guillardia theta CCMP2712]|uniref:PDZ domain-containing protein n=1 Tax=Guillardia theta (strain CCMP2712) TaxID=905079 RepID=L1IM20_GUITC|nr:hypothetical protein GUITHDRAFT_165522 [Guillardia theta CCMP2712]EKX37313.1 hypothetical protein GUITHDRAFT_165522 [Guillardia theta CCMP2712]|eukprot:XP_005824293.1 hypothetical protein GUITHDRAFT_165522 [Guillardia theta CCMP2712]
MQSSFDRLQMNGYTLTSFYDKYYSLGTSPLASRTSRPSYSVAASPSYLASQSPSYAASQRDKEGTRTQTPPRNEQSHSSSSTSVRYVSHAPNEKHIVSITSPGTSDKNGASGARSGSNQAATTPRVAKLSDQRQLYRSTEQRLHDTNNFGVGIDIDPKTMTVTALKPGCSAALKGDISVGDELILVDGVQCKTSQDVLQHVLGRQGTEVMISFRRPNGQQYSVRLLRGGSDFIQFWERYRSLEVKVATLENENARLLSENGRMSRGKNYLSFDENNNNALIQLEQMKSHVNQLETQNQELRQRVSSSTRASVEDRNEGHVLQQMAEVHEKNAVLQMQVASLQKLLHEKDDQIYSLNRKNIELHQSNMKLMHDKDLERYPQKDLATPPTPPLVSSKRQTLDSHVSPDSQHMVLDSGGSRKSPETSALNGSSMTALMKERNGASIMNPQGASGVSEGGVRDVTAGMAAATPRSAGSSPPPRYERAHTTVRAPASQDIQLSQRPPPSIAFIPPVEMHSAVSVWNGNGGHPIANNPQRMKQLYAMDERCSGMAGSWCDRNLLCKGLVMLLLCSLRVQQHRATQELLPWTSRASACTTTGPVFRCSAS